MAPLRTYQRNQEVPIDKSFRATYSRIFTKTAPKRLNPRRKLLSKEISSAIKTQLTDDESLVVNKTESSFDKLLKGKVFNSVKTISNVVRVNSSTETSTSRIIQETSVSSPIMTRSRSKKKVNPMVQRKKVAKVPLKDHLTDRLATYNDSSGLTNYSLCVEKEHRAIPLLALSNIQLQKATENQASSSSLNQTAEVSSMLGNISTHKLISSTPLIQTSRAKFHEPTSPIIANKCTNNRHIESEESSIMGNTDPADYISNNAKLKSDSKININNVSIDTDTDTSFFQGFNGQEKTNADNHSSEVNDVLINASKHSNTNELDVTSPPRRITLRKRTTKRLILDEETIPEDTSEDFIPGQEGTRGPVQHTTQESIVFSETSTDELRHYSKINLEAYVRLEPCQIPERKRIRSCRVYLTPLKEIDLHQKYSSEFDVTPVSTKTGLKLSDHCSKVNLKDTFESLHNISSEDGSIKENLLPENKYNLRRTRHTRKYTRGPIIDNVNNNSSEDDKDSRIKDVSEGNEQEVSYLSHSTSRSSEDIVVNSNKSYTDEDLWESNGECEETSKDFSRSSTKHLFFNSNNKTDDEDGETTDEDLSEDNSQNVIRRRTRRQTLKKTDISNSSSSRIDSTAEIFVISSDSECDSKDVFVQSPDLFDESESPLIETQNGDEDILKTPQKDEIICKQEASSILTENSAVSEMDDIVDTDVFKKPLEFVTITPGKKYKRNLYRLSRQSVSMQGGKLSNDAKRSGELMAKHSRRSVITPINNENLNSTSILKSYAQHITGHVPGYNTFETHLDESLRELSLNARSPLINNNECPTNHHCITAKDIVLRRCRQVEPLPFEECYPESILKNCQKIGEGVYGEVFLFRNLNHGTSAVKVIPIEGDLVVNGEKQKKYDEILSEIVIAMELTNLRNNKINCTDGFSEVQNIRCVRGKYPPRLIDLWDLWDENHQSENDCPTVFEEEQLFIVLELANGGKDLESYIFQNALQAFSMFKQTACALAVAEKQLNFEHRDLHWGNILINAVEKNKKLHLKLDGKSIDLNTHGVEVAIIDFTLSRIDHDDVAIYTDLTQDDELFRGSGDYQFDIYRMMKQYNGNKWEQFHPVTNIFWLHYVLDKIITAVKYKNTRSKIHKQSCDELKRLQGQILSFESVSDFVNAHFF